MQRHRGAFPKHTYTPKLTGPYYHSAVPLCSTLGYSYESFLGWEVEYSLLSKSFTGLNPVKLFFTCERPDRGYSKLEEYD